MFGNNTTAKGPIGNLFDSTLGQLDQVLDDALGTKVGTRAKPKATAITAPSAPPPAPMADTPGRHKTLLGA